MLWRRDLTLLLFIHIIQAASISRNLPFSLIENGPQRPILVWFLSTWQPPVASALAPCPSCATVLQYFLPSWLGLSSLCACDSFCLENWNFPCSTPPTPQYLANLYHPLGLSWDIICSNGLLWPLLRYERSHSSYHNLQQENCSLLGAVVPGIRKTLSIYLRNEWIIAYSYILTSICLAVFFFF